MTKSRLGSIFGSQNDSLIILIVATSLLYIGSGGWTEERWSRAASGAVPAITGILYGKKKGEQEGEQRGWAAGWDRGYNTYNPDLSRPEQTTPEQTYE